MWAFWLNYKISIYFLFGHITVAQVRHEYYFLENIIRKENNLEYKAITWENITKTNRVVFCRYVALRNFYKIGHSFILFKSFDFIKINRILAHKKPQGAVV
jgi:hypothetical protein